jgi:hypothetical protein
VKQGETHGNRKLPADPRRADELRGYLAEWKTGREAAFREVGRLKKELAAAQQKLCQYNDDIADAVAELKYRHGIKDVSAE